MMYMYNPDQDFQYGQYLTDNPNKVSLPDDHYEAALPEPDANEDDQQIFVPKPRTKSVTAPV